VKETELAFQKISESVLRESFSANSVNYPSTQVMGNRGPPGNGNGPKKAATIPLVLPGPRSDADAAIDDLILLLLSNHAFDA
jgi:hypothetical protein